MTSEEKNALHEDVYMLKLILDSLGGMKAIAEIHSAGCSTEWLAIDYGLETTVDVLKELVQRMELRINPKGSKDKGGQ